MRRREQLIWDAMRNNKPDNWRLWRIENIVTFGMADVWALRDDGYSCWIELKHFTRPKTMSSYAIAPSKINASQNAFHEVVAKMNGKSYYLFRDNKYDLYLLPGGEFKAMSFEDLRYWVIPRIANRDPWADLFKNL